MNNDYGSLRQYFSRNVGWNNVYGMKHKPKIINLMHTWRLQIQAHAYMYICLVCFRLPTHLSQSITLHLQLLASQIIRWVPVVQSWGGQISTLDVLASVSNTSCTGISPFCLWPICINSVDLHNNFTETLHGTRSEKNCTVWEGLTSWSNVVSCMCECNLAKKIMVLKIGKNSGFSGLSCERAL